MILCWFMGMEPPRLRVDSSRSCMSDHDPSGSGASLVGLCEEWSLACG